MNKLDILPEENVGTRELIGKPPSLVILYGSGLIFLVLVILLIFSYFVQIPDIVPAPITVGNGRSVSFLSAGEKGQFVPLVEEGTEVTKGEPIGLITGNGKVPIRYESPGKGRISFLSKTTVQAGEKLAALISPDSTLLTGKIWVTPEMAAPIKTGQPVTVDLYDPGATPRTLSGAVSTISRVSDGSHYLVTVKFALGSGSGAGFGSSGAGAGGAAGTRVQEGRARIVTGEKRLINRIFNRLNK